MSARTDANDWVTVVRFCEEMQSTLSRWHPEHEWIVTPKFVKEFDDGVSFSMSGSAPARFLIFAGDAQLADREIKSLVCLSCDGEDYYKAEDQEKWLRRAAGKILHELRAEQGNKVKLPPG